MKKENHKKEDLFKQPFGRGLGEYFKNMYDAIAKGEDKFTFNDKEHDITESNVAEYFAAIESDTKKNQRFTNDQEQIVMTLVKKIQDEDLDPIEIALTYQRLMDDFGLSLIEIAEYSGTDRSTVTNYIRLLKLDPLIQSGIRNNLISLGHARSLCTVESTEDQKSIYQDILNKNLSVRQTEYRVNAFRNSDQTIIEILNRFEKIERMSGSEKTKALVDKLNSLRFCYNWGSTPMRELSRNEIKGLNLGSKVRFSDFNEKTLSKLVSGEISAILELECSSYAYVPNSSIRPLTNDDIDEFISVGEPLGELNELPIAKFGRKIRTEDITELGIGHLEITIYQNVTKFIVKVIETWINDKQWRESHAEECADDACLSIHTSVWGPSWVTHEVFDDELGASCHIDEGGIREGLHGVMSLGYTIDHEFGVTTHYNMNDDEWSGTVYFAKPEN